ncbi:hypothetical protein U3516DRAFT_776587 [Neocallimastix sp. 'constans']
MVSEFYTTSTPNVDLYLQSAPTSPSYCNNTLVLRVRDSYYKYQSIKRTEAPACPLAQASCTTRTSDSPTRFIRLGFSTIDLYLIFLIYKIKFCKSE